MKPVSMFFVFWFFFFVFLCHSSLEHWLGLYLCYTLHQHVSVYFMFRSGPEIIYRLLKLFFFFFFLHLNHCSQFSLSYCTYCSCTMYATKWQGYVGCHTFCSDLFHKVANRTASVKLEVVANKNNNAAYQTRRHTAIK